MISLKQIKIDVRKLHNRDKKAELVRYISKLFNLNPSDIKAFKIIKESLDARKKPEIYYIYNVAFSLDKKKEAALTRLKKKGQIQIDYYEETNYEFPVIQKSEFERPLVVGSGPAGLFAAYMLAEKGFRPILIERGSAMKERKEYVESFYKTGKLDKSSNIQFGEGGAGTFSDGKLNTGTKDKRGIHKKVLDIFIENGADESIAYENKPHIGTDVLEKIVVSMRQKIINNGGTVLFNKKLTGFKFDNNTLKTAIVNDEEEFIIENMILAIGHSARDTFKMIFNNKIDMKQKPFAVGVRVVHEQSFINNSQYGSGNEFLPAADYKITTHTSNDKNVYSFCMCPGGYVVPAASFEKETVVNGMSNSKRDGEYANSAIVVNVNSKDFGSEDIFAGMNFQEQLEFKTYQLANGLTPIQSYEGFKNKALDTDVECINAIAGKSVFGLTANADISGVFSENIYNALCEGLILADSKLRGFSENIKLIAGVESRTSSPVKILRNDLYESNIRGIYPCGEGAGYAGGIMSAAVDGIKVAEAVANKINGE